MDRRLKLHNILIDILGTDKVYFQPPENCKIQYPCIIYKIKQIDSVFANDKPYSHQKQYQVTIIDRNPDSKLPDKLSELPTCYYETFFTSDNLNHYIFNIYF